MGKNILTKFSFWCLWSKEAPKWAQMSFSKFYGKSKHNTSIFFHEVKASHLFFSFGNILLLILQV